LCFQGLPAFFATPDARLGCGFVQIALGVTSDQPRNPLAHLGDLLLDLSDLGLTRWKLYSLQAALLFRRDPLGGGQKLADGLPNRRFQLVRPKLGIMTDPVAPEPIGSTTATAIIGIGS
jgi:hypothetical protein